MGQNHGQEYIAYSPIGRERKEYNLQCTLSKITVDYETIGAGKPIVMLHGYGVDRHLMKGCMEPIFQTQPGWRRIYLDLPGMGRTPGAEWIKNSDQMLEIVIEFIATVLPKENLVVAGESYGGYLARGLVKHQADRLDGVLLICPCIIAPRAQRRLPKFEVLEADPTLIAGLTVAEREEFVPMAVVQNATTWKRFQMEIMPGVALADEPFLTHLQRNGYAFSFDPDRLEQPFSKPVLLLTGRQDASVGYQDALTVIENYSRGTFVVLDKAGHNLQIEQAGLFEALVKEWLERVEKEEVRRM